jgi:hypothetical protein
MEELQSILKHLFEGQTSVAERAVTQFLPWLERVRAGAKSKIDDVAVRALGGDFAERLAIIERHYAERGEDPFGLDLEYPKYGALTTAFLHRFYFRTEVKGVENVPKGRALLVANHAGQLPIDGVLMCTSMFLDANPPRLVRAMVERWIPTLPFVSTFFSRIGQVVGVPDNCRRLLDRDELILVFPEGVRGISKPYTERYQLQPFGVGFVRLAIQSRAPVVPVAIIGSEEQYISLGNMKELAVRRRQSSPAALSNCAASALPSARGPKR